jgi:hypothetical protein
VRVSHRQLIIRTPSTHVEGVFYAGKKILRRKVEKERKIKPSEDGFNSTGIGYFIKLVSQN